MRKLLILLVVVVALLAVADRVALSAAQHDVAKRLQADSHLQTTPKVEIHGFPFLTQLIGGDYHSVDVVMNGLDSDGLRVDRLSVHVQGAHVSISDVISQSRSHIRIDKATATVHLTYADIVAFLTKQAGTRLPGHTINHSTITGAGVRGGDTVVLQTSFGVPVPLTLGGLPFGIRLTSAKATQSGVDVTGVANGLVLNT